jgi:uncharacterized protein
MSRSLSGVAAAIFALSLFWAGAAGAASFDCKAAASRIEKLVCGDPSLDSFDSQLQGAYQGALDRSNHPAGVTERQRAWLKARDACADVTCLTKAYQQQIAALSKLTDEPAICSGSTTPEVEGCAAEYSHRADKELARYVAAARKRLTEETKAGAGTGGGTVAHTLTGFDAAQAAWVSFRKAQCDAVYDWWSEGTIRGTMYQGCWLATTKARSLDVWATWLSFMDDTPPLLARPVGK